MQNSLSYRNKAINGLRQNNMIDPGAQNSRFIKNHFNKYLWGIPSESKDKKIMDMPAGSGSTTEIFLKIGAKVEAFDLFPQFACTPKASANLYPFDEVM